MYPDFELVVPTTLSDALAELDGSGDLVLPIAGGTNLMIDMRARRTSPDKLVSLTDVSGFRQISRRNGRVEIGGGTTLSDILYSDDMREVAPSLHASAQVFGGQMVRNTATIAGNVCSGSPAADTVPPLLTLDAVLTLSNIAGDREVPLSEFYTGFKQDARKQNEIVSKIHWEVVRQSTANYFYKLGLRKGDAITIVGIAVLVTVNDGVCSKARIALGSVAPVVKRATKAEAMLAGEELSDDLIEEAARCAVNETSPIDDLRASGAYRRHCTQALTHRLLDQARQELAD